MGSAVAEVLAEKARAPVRFVGVRDKFGESGKGSELLKKFGLTSEFIAAAAKEVTGKRK